MDDELLLLHPVAYPIESHVNGFGPALFDDVIDDASGTGVVGLDGCRRLWMD